MDWDGYEVYDPGFWGPPNELPRREARAAFERLMEARPARREAMRRLLAANGVELGGDDRALGRLNKWFRDNVEGASDSASRLQPRWYSVVNDIGLFLGDTLIERCPNLRWELYTHGKRSASYQCHVIMGFEKIPNPKYDLNLDASVAAYAERVVLGMEVTDDEFVEWLNYMQAKA